MSKVAIMQPTFLPWVGYFDLIDQVDYFVLLNDVQFQKQTWQHRNRILTKNGLLWLTIPVITKGHFGQNIKDTSISHQHFPGKLLSSIRHSYASSKYFTLYWDELQQIFLDHIVNTSLQSLNTTLIRWACSILGIKTPLYLSSDLPKRSERSTRLVDIITYFRSQYYLSPYGARDYLREDQSYFRDSSINVHLQSYQVQKYKQLYPGFTEGTCFLDLLFNCGPDAYDIIKLGSRSPIPL